MAGISEMKANIVSVGGGILIFMITAVIMVFMTIEYNKGKEFEILQKEKSEERYHQHQSTNNLDTVSTSTSLSIRCFSLKTRQPVQKSVNLQFNTVGRRDDDMIVPPSDGPMIIWIDWE